MASSSKSFVSELFHPQGSFKFPSHKFGSTERSFRVTWCDNYPWVRHCKSGGKSRRTQLFAGVLREPYQPARNDTKTNE